MSDNQTDSIRLDIWLWRARFLKTRAMASHFVNDGKVRLIRGQRGARMTKPHYQLRIGDQLVFIRAEKLYNIEVLDFGTRRGPAGEAQGLYRETVTDSPDAAAHMSG